MGNKGCGTRLSRGGKTGTAKKIGDDGKYVDKYVAYTAGVAPASDPKFALVVVINNPQNGAYYGGAVSAPVFSQIMGMCCVWKTLNRMACPLTRNTCW